MAAVVSVVIATRVHLAKSKEPPTDLEEKIGLFAQFCYGEDSSGTELTRQVVGVIAVDAENRIAGFDLVESVRRICSDCATRAQGRRIHVLPVQPWGKFAPALNALVQWACETQSADQILFVSAETSAPREAALATLQSHMTEDTLVVGAVLPGHDHFVPDGCDTSVTCKLTGKTTPWNTLALWDLSKLSLTGFQLVSEGLRDSNMAGVEEATTIALNQYLFPDRSKAKLVPLDSIRWEQHFADPTRREWHQQKTQSKLERSAYQLHLLRLENGTVDHFSAHRTPNIHFVVTGFGPFDTFVVNPTQNICQNLTTHIHKSNSALGQMIVRTEIIETSAEAATQAIADIFFSCDPINTTILLHLGLNPNGTDFLLEQCAYNEATFRIPDQRGYQPKHESVVGNRPIEDTVETKLDVQLLADRMTETYQKVKTVVSQDPGRFVCNYTYYQSLIAAQDRSNILSLFVHIPDQSSLCTEDFLLYVEKLLEQLQSLSRAMPIQY